MVQSGSTSALQYAKAGKILKDAQNAMEQSLAAHRAATLEMQQRAETAEAEVEVLKAQLAEMLRRLSGQNELQHQQKEGGAEVEREREREREKQDSKKREEAEEALLKSKKEAEAAAEKAASEKAAAEIADAEKAAHAKAELDAARGLAKELMAELNELNQRMVFMEEHVVFQNGKAQGIAERLLMRLMMRGPMMCFNKWRDNAKKQRIMRTQVQKVKARWYRQKESAAWNTWRQVVQVTRRHSAILKRWKNRRILPAWNTWVEMLIDLRRARAFMMRWMARRYLRSFLGWVENFCEIRRQNLLMVKVQTRWTNFLLASAFQTWRQDAYEDARRLRIMSKIKKRWDRMRRVTSVQGWGIVSGVLPGHFKDVHEQWGQLASTSVAGQTSLQPYEIFARSLNKHIERFHPGLSWNNVGSEEPSGNEIRNEQLAAALQEKIDKAFSTSFKIPSLITFTKEEWDNVHIRSADLSRNSYIKAPNTKCYFKPAGGQMEEKMEDMPIISKLQTKSVRYAHATKT
jgi:hypothetical protein